MTAFQWLQLLGIPALTALIAGALFGGLKKKINASMQETDAIRRGVQALLRSQLYQCWELCEKKGFAGVEERENFENLYRQYHGMGKNGVMDDIRAKFLALPTREENAK